MQPFNMTMIYYWDKKIKKRLQVLDADMITIEKNIDLISLAKNAFLRDVFQMTAIFEINHDHINELHLF